MTEYDQNNGRENRPEGTGGEPHKDAAWKAWQAFSVSGQRKNGSQTESGDHAPPQPDSGARDRSSPFFGRPGQYAAPGIAASGGQWGAYTADGSQPGTATSRRSRLKPWQRGLLIFAAIFIGIAIPGFFFRQAFGPGQGAVSVPAGPYIARISVEGTISKEIATDFLGTPHGYLHKWTLDRIDDLIYDENNYGLLLYIDSPGGGVYESDELYLKIREYQDLTGNPVYVAMGSMAASGGYYIAAPADKIYANRNTWTGSIGVTMGTMFDLSEFLTRYGIRTETITSGSNKAMGSSFEPMTEQQRAIFQSLIDEAYDQFVGIIAEGRDMTVEDVRTLADGRIYTAAQAVSAGLVDEIADYETVVSNMQDLFDRYVPVIDVYYEDSSLARRFLGLEFMNLSGGLSFLQNVGKGDLTTALELADQQSGMPIRYLYEP